MSTLELATHVFGSSAEAMQWLSTPKRRFRGRTPLSLLATDHGKKQVDEVLEQARHGFTA